MLLLFIKGFIIGFAIAAPIGPISLICIQHTLQQGFKMGMMAGFGAALADGVYGLVVGLGLTSISSLLISHILWIRLIGGLILIYLGIKIFLRQPHKSKTKFDKSMWHILGTTFLLTLVNPTTIFPFIAIFAGIGIGTVHSLYFHALFTVLGIVAGAITWWVILNGSIAFFIHHRLTPQIMKKINHVSGCMIALFGLMCLIEEITR